MTIADRIKGYLVAAGCKGIHLTSGQNGPQFVSTCPFHTVKDGKQFAMGAETGLYLCYSARCGASGNLLSFLIDALDMDPIRASREYASLEIRSALDEGGQDDDDGIVAFEDRRRKAPEQPETDADKNRKLQVIWGSRCPKYMEDRGFSKRTLKRWGIGFDRENNRVTIPVYDAQGTLAGFSKRAVLAKDSPKYLHLGFSKSTILYGQNFAKGEKIAVVSEGQLDTLAVAQHIEEKAVQGIIPVATMGSKVGPRQVSALARFDKVILAFDNFSVDEDGYKTTYNVGNLLLPRMGPDSVYVGRYIRNHKDPGEMLEKGDHEALGSLIDLGLAVPFDILDLD